MLRVTGDDGTIVLTVPPSKEDNLGKKVVDLDNHAALVRSGKPTVGNVLLGPRGLPAFPVRVAVIRQGKVVYGLTSIVRPSMLADIINRNGLPRAWLGWIADGQGKLIVSTFGDSASITHPASELVSLGERSSTGLMSGSIRDGRQIRLAAVPVQGTGWTIYVGVSAAAYAAATTQGFYVLGISAFATLVLSCLAAFLFLRELAARRRDEAALASWQRIDALGKLTGGMAHDFNNLLMVFQSGTESIRRRPEDLARMKRILDGMNEAVARGRTLTQRLLSFSRRSNRDAVTTSVQDHLPLFKDSLAQAGQELVDLKFDFAADLWPVKIDPQSLETALINLVTNAREAMPKGGAVTVSAQNVAELSGETRRLKGPGLAVTVADEGTGISAGDIPRIYEPFYTTKDGAPGLGLSQVAAFAERSGGMVQATSTGKGSVFTIFLPRDESAVFDSTAPSDASALPASVLVVDDTQSSLSAAQMTLEDAGVRTFTATSGQAATAVLNVEKVEGVLTDIRMPGMSGLDLLAHIKSNHPAIPVVLMTGFSEAMEQGHQVDVPVVTKPFTSAQLRNAFAAAMSKAAGANRAASSELR
jgi:signal transduction histidine kinase/ActR/RegA family two-component response regulator